MSVVKGIELMLMSEFSADIQMQKKPSGYSVTLGPISENKILSFIPTQMLDRVNDVRQYVARELLDKLERALFECGSEAVYDRKLFFDTGSASTWKKRLDGSNAPALSKLFTITHRSTKDKVYNVVCYAPKFPCNTQNGINVAYKMDKGQITFENLGDSPAYVGLLNGNPNMGRISFSLIPGRNIGIHVNGINGVISAKAGLSKDDRTLVDYYVEELGEKCTIILECEVEYMAKTTIQKRFHKHTLKIEDQVVTTDVEQIEDPGVFTWAEHVHTPCDFVLNPISAASSFKHLLQEDEPIMIGEKVWITSRQDVYIKLEGHWFLQPFSLGEIDTYTNYLPEELYKEIKRAALAVNLGK